MSVSDPREVELKLDMDAAALKRIRSRCVAALSSDDVVSERLTATYFDTNKLRLHQRGISLRVRREGGRTIQTMKGEGRSGGGLFDRLEWNMEIVGQEPDLAAVGQSPFGDALSGRGAGRRVRPVFTTEVERTRWTVRSQGAEIEVALDEGKVIAGERTQPLRELELELKRGPVSELFRVARSIADGGALKVGVMAKSERGYALLADDAAFFKAEPLHIDPASATEDAFKAIVRSCIRHFRRNEPHLVETRAADALHQCRVAVRRLRSALSLFKGVIGDEELERLKDRLRSISERLGEARDLDVYLATLSAGADGAPAANDVASAEQLGKKREEAYDRVIAALHGKQARTLLFDVLAWAEAGPWLTTPGPAAEDRKKPIARFAAEILERRTKRIKKRGRHLEALTPPARHAVRIEAKKLRYAGEFFASLADSKNRRRRQEAFASALAALQEHLGELNDLATQEKFKDPVLPRQEGIAGASASDVSPGPADDTGEGPAAEALKAAVEAFRDLTKAKPFWDSPGSKAKD